MMNLIETYANLIGIAPNLVSAGAVAYLANLQLVTESSPALTSNILQELEDQQSSLKLIASENYSSLSVQAAMGNLLTDKYAEGYPLHRFYAGCDNVDRIESDAVEAANRVFGSEYAYVQPHSGADANLVAFLSALNTRIAQPILFQSGTKSALGLADDDWANLRHQLRNQSILAMGLADGGHLTHGYRLNISAQLFTVNHYGVDEKTGALDYDEIRAQALRHRPLVLLAGYSAYTHLLDFSAFRSIADECGAVLMADMAHFAGLVAGGVFHGEHSPIGYADLITSTTHKTLRGPRGGMILATPEFAAEIDRGCPAILGGPLPHMMAAKLVAFNEAGTEDFAVYARQVVRNAKALAASLQDNGLSVVGGGTENHMVLVDVASEGLTGRQAETALRQCGITLNRNMIPGDTQGPWYTSGLRLGTAAVTTLGMGESEMAQIAKGIAGVVRGTRPATKGGPSKARFELSESDAQRSRAVVQELVDAFPLYPDLNAAALRSVLLA